MEMRRRGRRWVAGGGRRIRRRRRRRAGELVDRHVVVEGRAGQGGEEEGDGEATGGEVAGQLDGREGVALAVEGHDQHFPFSRRRHSFGG